MHFFKVFCAALLSLGAASVSHAQASYPSKPIVWTVPWSAGGSADLASRTIAAELSKQLGQPVSIDNIGGGGGMVGLSKFLLSAPDGYSIYLGGTELYVPTMLNPNVRTNWKATMTPVAQTAILPMVLATRASAPFSTLEEFTKYVKANPGRVSYASPGIGSGQHMLGEMMRDRAKLAMVHIPYRGGAQIVTDLLGGTIDVAVLIGSTALPHVRNGKLKVLAVADAARIPLFPNAPTFSETKEYAGVSLAPWQGIFLPAGAPPAVVERLSKAIEVSLKNDEVRAKLEEAGFKINFANQAKLVQFMEADALKYKRIVDATGMKVTE